MPYGLDNTTGNAKAPVVARPPTATPASRTFRFGGAVPPRRYAT
jgi:hypothetical protein